MSVAQPKEQRLLYTALDDVIIKKIALITPVDYVESIQPH
jgi:hypothetical protein